MKYPKLTEIPSSRKAVDVFRGYNHNLRINDGEFYDMKNLSSTNYPVLTPRPARGTYRATVTSGQMSGAQGIISKGVLYIVNHEHLYIDGHIIYRDDYPSFPELGEGEKQLVSMGAYLIILPDKVWVNTSKVEYVDDVGFLFDDNAYGYIEHTFDSSSNKKTKFTLGLLEGDYIKADWEQTTKPTNPGDGQLWLDTSASPCVLKRYSSQSQTWTEIYNTYLRIETDGIGKEFSQGDCIKVYDILSIWDMNDKRLPDYLEQQIKAFAGMHTILRCEDDAITISGTITEPVTISTGILIGRHMPDMDFVVEANNRLWGCRYGEDNQGNLINEIYASKLGDFKNWNSFDGTSQDSYAASCGTDGAFTGAITYQGNPIFFKEGFMHKVYGSFPANFQIQASACRGVQEGCSKSLAIVNEVLFYKSRSGICAYDGSLPTDMSYVFGGEPYSDAAAGALGGKYYVSMKNSSGQYTLFVYDTAKGLWHKEDNTHAQFFCTHGSDLYYIDADNLSVKNVLGTVGKDTAPVEWMAETGVMTESPDKQYISRINIRLQLDFGSTVRFAIQYDSAGEWETVCVLAGQNLDRTFTIPIKPKRSDHMRLRIYGVGNAKIYSITKTIEQGSDV